MEKFYKFFEGNPWLNIVFLVLSIISVILAIIFYYKSIKSKKPTYNIFTNRLVNNNLSRLNKIEIKYNGAIVTNLSVSKIALWNAGKESIRRIDIASSDPISISTKENIILYDYEIVYAKPVNNITIEKKDEKAVNVAFEFLDLYDGIVLNIYHSGDNSSSIIINGTLIGSEKISKAIIKDYLSDKTEILSRPINILINHSNRYYNFVGWFLAIPIGAVFLIPIFFFIVPIDRILEKVYFKIPKEYNFDLN